MIRIGILLAFTSLLPARDWTQHPAVIQMDTAQDIFAIGDAHSDHDRLATLLAAAKLIDQPRNPQWTGGKSVVVLTGDFIDKGPQALQTIGLLRSLQTNAARAGGRIIILAGNHEIEFLASPHSKKAEEFVNELTRAGMNAKAIASCKGDLGEFFCSLPFAARVNDWFFSHAGNTQGRTMKQLIADLESGVDVDGYSSKQLLDENSLLEARLGNDPWFARNGADAKATLQAYTAALGVHHIVQGHQPNAVTLPDGTKRSPGEMFQRYGLIFLEDTGMSEGVNNSRGGLLRIRQNEATGICSDGSSATIWDKSTHADVGRMPPCGVQ
jgi:predicted MPP superfamily phosphohydrolase